MFKNLRKKLGRFEEELESALEEELERQLERELARSTEEPGEEVPAPEAPREDVSEPAPPLPPSPPPAEPMRPSAPLERPEGETPRPKDEAPREPEKRPEQPPARPEPKPTPQETPQPPAPIEPAARTPPPPSPAPTPQGGKVRTRRPGGPVVKTEKELASEVEASIQAELGREVESARELESLVRERAEGVRMRISEERLDDLLWELEVVLLESDVALPVVEAIKSNVRDQLREARVPRRGAGDFVEEVLRAAIRRVLNEPFDFDGYVEKAPKPIVIMFVGVNGTGKTTSIAKIAHRLKTQGRSVVLAAGDTFRAGAVAQLEKHAERLGVRVIKHEGKNADPAAVAFDAIEHAKSRHKDVVLLDTAGRQQTNKNLMAEMEKVKRVAQPDLIFFVGDSLAGNDAVTQADEFNAVVGIDGVILTKVDADAKGGAALSVAYAIGKPLVFIGIGQEYEDQVPFDRDWMLDRLFGQDALEAPVA